MAAANNWSCPTIMILNNTELEEVFHILYQGTREDIVGHNIEKYFDDFKCVRLVPYSIVMERADVWNNFSEYALAKYVTDILELKREKIDIEKFEYMGCEHDSVDHRYRNVLKSQWLTTDIMDNGCREPVTIQIFPHYDKNLKRVLMQANVHPGAFRWQMFRLCDIDPLCIVFDAFDMFQDYDKVGLKECLDLFLDDQEKFEVSILPNNDNYLCPQIMNIASNSINIGMTETIESYDKKVRDIWNEDINIFIGYDSRQGDVHEACWHSIIKASPQLENHPHIHVKYLDTSKIPEYTREYGNQNVEFSYSRFLIPFLSDYKGWSIFCDNDYIFERNILNLLLYITDEKAVSVVHHDYTQKYDSKFDDQKDVWYPKKLWSSLMVFNNGHEDCKRLTPEVVNTETGKYLHQFEWTESIGKIPNRWVWTEGYDDPEKFHDYWAKHWTRGGYWIDDMNTDDIFGLTYHSIYSNFMLNLDEYPIKQRSFIDPRKYFHMDGMKFKNDNSKMCRPNLKEE